MKNEEEKEMCVYKHYCLQPIALWMRVCVRISSKNCFHSIQLKNSRILRNNSNSRAHTQTNYRQARCRVESTTLMYDTTRFFSIFSPPPILIK